MGVVIMDMLMIGFGCAGAQTPDQNKWFFFIFGMVTFIHICAVLLKYSKVNKYGEEARALYNKVAWMTIILWTLYPIVWIVAEGQRMVRLFGSMLIRNHGCICLMRLRNPYCASTRSS